MIVLDLSILNQKGTPMFNSDTFANRPAFGIVGRIFISTDTKEFYRDTGTSWELIGGPGTGTITGSGAAGQVTYFTGASSVTGNNNLFWDTTNNRLRVGGDVITFIDNSGIIVGNDNNLGFVKKSGSTPFIGIGSSIGFTISRSNTSTSFPSNTFTNIFDISAANNIATLGSLSVGGIQVGDNYGIEVQNEIGLIKKSGSGGFVAFPANRDFRIQQSTANSVNASNTFNTRFQIFQTTGNVVLQNGGTFTDNGSRLQVTGAGYFSDIVGIGATPSAGNSLLISNNIAGTFGTGILQNGQVQSNVTGSSFGFLNTLNIVNTAFTTSAVAFAASQGTIGGSVTLINNTGFLAASSLNSGTNVFGFRGQIASGTNRWNLYMEGTANNYMAGNLLIKTTTDTGYSAQITGTGDNMLSVWGSTAPSIRLDNAASGASRRLVIGLATGTNNFIQGAVANDACISTASSNPLLFGMWVSTSATEVMRISTALNLQIGSITDTGEKFQLTGSIRINGQRSATSGGNSGQHLIINLDGTTYKIKLELP